MANIPSTSGQSASSTQTGNGQSYRGPFAIMTILFFMWGFMTVWNDILIPHFKEAFTLNYTEAMLVQLAFFGAYGVGSAIYFAISMTSGDPINRIGYKNGVIIGLLIAALGSALFVPAANAVSYPLFLTALFHRGHGLCHAAPPAIPTLPSSERTASSAASICRRPSTHLGRPSGRSLAAGSFSPSSTPETPTAPLR